MLLTVLGEFAYPDEPMWTTALVHALAGLGLEASAVRQAIARSAADGWLQSERQGRAVRWTLTSQGRRTIEDGKRREAQFLMRSEPWDGSWLYLFVTIPQSERTLRRRLYGGLSWLGMGNPSPGVWVTPHVDVSEDLRALVSRFDLRDSAMSVVGKTQDIGMSDQQIVRRSWDLDDLAGHYHRLLEQYGGHRRVADHEVLWRHLELRNVLQRFLRLDPRLPEELLPNWVGHEAAEVFRSRNEEWLPAARQSWKQLMGQASSG